MIDSCHSYDFRTNLYNYIYENGNQDTGTPNIITETNRAQLGYGTSSYGYKSLFLAGLAKEKEKGKALTYGDVYDAEKHFFNMEDMSISIGSKEGVIDIGSKRDDPDLKLVSTPGEEGATTTGTSAPEPIPQLRNPMAVEICEKVSPEMQQKLGVQDIDPNELCTARS
jgi:hypothetical protein